VEAEVLGGIVIVMIAAGLLYQMSTAYLRAREVLMLERTLRLAAQAELERYRAGTRVGTPPPKEVLPAGVTLTATTQPGSGVWSGMIRVTVTASGQDHRQRPHHVAVSGYLREGPPQ